jgi:hypothetical protein
VKESHLLTALVLSPFCVFHKELLLPTYPLSLRRNLYKILVFVQKKDMDFFTCEVLTKNNLCAWASNLGPVET